ncbi:MAG: alpha/beta fold hydrolase, partial [Caulobacteraceae bacterium]
VLHPSKVRAVAGLSVPYFGHLPMPATHIYKAQYTDQGKFFYQVYFQDEGVAEAEFKADVRGGLRKLYYAASGEADGMWGRDKVHGDQLLTGVPDPDPFPAWLTAEDIDYFVGEFERSGFRGPINRYRNFERDWEMMNGVTDRIVHQPSLFISGDSDLVIRVYGEAMLDRMRENTSDLRGVHIIPGIGHWTQQEAPAKTTGLLIDWLATL